MSYNKVEKISSTKYCAKNIVKKINISHLSSTRQNVITRCIKSICQFLGAWSLIFLVEYNVFLSITFPVFPSFQFSKLSFFRDSSFSFQWNKTLSNKYQYSIPVPKSSYYLKLFSCRIGYCFLATIVHSYDDTFKPWVYENCLRYTFDVDIFHSF